MQTLADIHYQKQACLYHIILPLQRNVELHRLRGKQADIYNTRRCKKQILTALQESTKIRLEQRHHLEKAAIQTYRRHGAKTLFSLLRSNQAQRKQQQLQVQKLHERVLLRTYLYQWINHTHTRSKERAGRLASILPEIIKHGELVHQRAVFRLFRMRVKARKQERLYYQEQQQQEAERKLIEEELNTWLQDQLKQS